jgi:hypothetical protein
MANGIKLNANGWVFAKLPLQILQIKAQMLMGNFANTLLPAGAVSRRKVQI